MRYVKTWPDGVFMAWDTCKLNALCEYATQAKDLEVKMGLYNFAIFNELAPGEEKLIGPPGTHQIKFFRAW